MTAADAELVIWPRWASTVWRMETRSPLVVAATVSSEAAPKTPPIDAPEPRAEEVPDHSPWF
jgi:hypothetical protein